MTVERTPVWATNVTAPLLAVMEAEAAEEVELAEAEAAAALAALLSINY